MGQDPPARAVPDCVWASIVHDFGNMLQVAQSALLLINRRIDAGKLDDLGTFVLQARESLSRAADLNRELTAFARGGVEDPEIIDMNGFILEIENRLRYAVGDAVALSFTLTDRVGPVRCRRRQLENALLNLAINARDAMRNGGQLSIETLVAHLAPGRSHLKEGPYVAICVRDEGHGMCADTVKRAFVPFFTTKGAGRGTGLGLFMVHEFAAQHRGHAEIESAIGKGTTVRLYLPCT